MVIERLSGEAPLFSKLRAPRLPMPEKEPPKLPPARAAARLGVRARVRLNTRASIRRQVVFRRGEFFVISVSIRCFGTEAE